MLTLADFTGYNWHISRPIEDRRAGMSGEFRGAAVLRPHGEGLLYHETGRLRLGKVPVLAAERKYLWLQADDRIEVRFEDGRPFHSFRPEGRAAGTDHPCGRDLYRVTYDFTAWPAWSSEWVVVGPAKDYVMSSRYERSDAPI